MEFWCPRCRDEFKKRMETVCLEQESGLGWSIWETERRERAEMFWEAGEEIEQELREWFEGVEKEEEEKKAKAKQGRRDGEEVSKQKGKDSGQKRGSSFLRFFKGRNM
jgi:flagellar biosynthesis/type III secretory pathway protein FliH